MDRYNLTKRKSDDFWRLTKEGNVNPSLTAETKSEAIQKMREFMVDKTGSVKIHLEKGPIQEERTYQRSDDPVKSKG